MVVAIYTIAVQKSNDGRVAMEQSSIPRIVIVPALACMVPWFV